MVEFFGVGWPSYGSKVSVYERWQYSKLRKIMPAIKRDLHRAGIRARVELGKRGNPIIYVGVDGGYSNGILENGTAVRVQDDVEMLRKVMNGLGLDGKPVNSNYANDFGERKFAFGLNRG